jgi:hypothetical protein
LIAFVVPYDARHGSLIVLTPNGRSNGIWVAVISPYISRLSSTTAKKGESITIYGGNFGNIRGAGYVMFGTVRSTDYDSWSNSRISATVPATVRAGTTSLKVVTQEGESGESIVSIEDALETLPSNRLMGYDPPSITGNPKAVRFGFEGIDRELGLSFSARLVDEGEVQFFINNKPYDVPESRLWRSWWLIIPETTLESSNVLEFRNVSNTSRSSNFDTWLLKEVKIWRPYNSKAIAGSNIGIAGSILGSPFPIPFNSSVSIPFFLGSDQEVSISVYNQLGQFISTLVDDRYYAGSHLATWNGTDWRGTEVASGVYLVRLRAGPSFSDVVRVTLVK